MSSDSLLEKLTLEEKLSLFSGKNFWQSQSFPQAGIESITFSDGPSGLRRQTDKSDHLGSHESLPAICWPVPGTLANSWNPELIEEVGRQMGREARKQGVDVLLAPCLNVKRNPLGGRNFEYISSSPYLTAILGLAYIKGIEESVYSCPKHFLMNSQETWRHTVSENPEKMTLNEQLKPFLKAADKISFLMSAYNRVYGTYCHENEFLDQAIRNAGFQGMIVSDWGGVNSIEKEFESLHLEMPSTDGQSLKILTQAIQDGTLATEKVDERVQEYFKLNQKVVDKRNRTLADVQDLSLEAALESIVLLKNEQILPLKDESYLWIGDFEKTPFQGTGSSHVHTLKEENFKKLLKKMFPSRQFFLKEYDPEGILRFHNKVKAVCLLLSVDEVDAAEGIDRQHLRPSLKIRQVMRECKKQSLPIIAIYAGPAGLVQSAQDLGAYVYMGLAGQSRLEALLTLLKGKQDFTARLAGPFFTCEHEMLKTNRTYELNDEDFLSFHDFYRKQLSFYPLGYGCSLNEYEISAENDGLSFTVRAENKSNRDGALVFQVYLQADSFKRLVAFRREKFRPFEKKEFILEVEAGEISFWKAFLKDHKKAHLWLSTDGEKLIKGCSVDMYQFTPAPVFEIPDRLESGLQMRNWPLETLDHSNHKAFSKTISILKKIRDRSIETGKPNWFLISFLNMPVRTQAKIASNIFDWDLLESFEEGFVKGELSPVIKELLKKNIPFL